MVGQIWIKTRKQSDTPNCGRLGSMSSENWPRGTPEALLGAKSLGDNVYGVMEFSIRTSESKCFCTMCSPHETTLVAHPG